MSKQNTNKKPNDQSNTFASNMTANNSDKLFSNRFQEK